MQIVQHIERSERATNRDTCVMNIVNDELDHLDWPRQSYRVQFKEGDEEADRRNDGKTTSKSGLALNGIFYYGKPRTARSGGSWL